MGINPCGYASLGVSLTNDSVLGVGKMILGQVLASQVGRPEPEPQNPPTKPGMVAHACNHKAGETDRRGFPEFTGAPALTTW